MSIRDRRLDAVLFLASFAALLLPWYRQDEGFYSFGWLGDLAGPDSAAMLLQSGLGRPWLVLPLLALLAVGLARWLVRRPEARSWLLIAAGLAGLVFIVLEAALVGYSGWAYPAFDAAFGPLAQGQPALGAGAAVYVACLVMILSFGLSERGVLYGNAFVISAIASVIVLVGTFVFFPVMNMFWVSLHDFSGALRIDNFLNALGAPSVWGLGCFWGEKCGLAWNTLTLALATASAATFIGFCFALVVARTAFRFKRVLRLLTILPIITPPFVIGLALILLLGRSGTVTQWAVEHLGLQNERWLYGLPGIWVAQVLSFAPTSFLIIVGVVQGVAPSLEEASQTLRADRWHTFRQVSLPLMKPGLANAFLIAFIESLADFGNPLVLGGNTGVLSTEIYFAVVGASADQARAGALALILLGFTLTAFIAQRLWLSGKNFATITGKGDAGTSMVLPRRVSAVAHAVALPWAVFTVLIYGLIFYGAFVKVWGLDHSLTLDHFRRAFAIGWDGGAVWQGVAWNSFWTTMQIALVAAPLTAALGILTAWLIVRQDFPGRSAFEFSLMLSFAIPGTVIGVAYVQAFNQPPVEMTGSALILVACFVFRNMPVGVRSGIAAMSQLDRSLDEASLTLRASSLRTLRKVVLPLLRPALISALTYSFVRSITSISAVIFLVSAEHNMATAYIVGLTENGEYGVAVAYSSTLIVVMVAVIGLFNLLVGERKLRRSSTPRHDPATPAPMPQAKEKTA